MTEAWFWIVVGLIGVLALVPALVWRRSSRSRLTLALNAVGLGLAAVWLVNLGLIASDHRDADGATDCASHCTDYQSGVRAVFFWVGAALVAYGITGVLGLLVHALGRGSSPARSR